ncbi:MAG: acyl-CoA dehydratase activase [Desulfobacterales bacterium]
MIYAGCDLGTISAKAVLIDDRNILAVSILPYSSLPRQAAFQVLEKALADAGLDESQIAFCLATGFGKKAVPFANGDIPELICLSRAAKALNPEIRTVIDGGGQSIKAFNMDAGGKVTGSSTNEKCASGTGKFMEVMAHALEMPVDSLSRSALASTHPLPITSQCGVFAESEVITHVNDGKDRLDIFAGISLSVAGKIAGTVRRIHLDEQVAMVGGLAKNEIVVRDLQNELNITLAEYAMDPQALSAYGAALMACEKCPVSL